MPVKPLNKEGYVDIFRKVLPSSYVEPLESQSDGSGMDLAYAYAAMFAAVDKASSQGTQEYFIRPHSDQTDESATGPRKASGSFLIARAGQIFGELTIWKGQIIEAYRTDSYGDEQVVGRYIVTQTTVLPGASGSPLELPIEAEYPGWFGNIEASSVSLRFAPSKVYRIPSMIKAYGDTIAIEYNSALETIEASDTFEPGVELYGRYCVISSAVGTPLNSDTNYPRRFDGILGVAALILPMPLASDANKGCYLNIIDWNDLGLVLTQPTAIDGGRGGTLDSRGNDCGCPRITGEDDEQYANRIEAISDVISPSAIDRIVDRILGPYGIAWRIYETRDPDGLGGFTWGVHPYSFGSLATVYGSGNEAKIQRGLWLSTSALNRFFVLVVSDTIKNYPYLSSKVWNAVNSARLEGVKFEMVASALI